MGKFEKKLDAQRQRSIKGDIQERLEDIKADKGLQQNDIAIMAGLSESMVSSYFNGEKAPNVSTLIKLSIALDVSTDYLLGLSEDPARTPAAVDELGLSPKAVQQLVTGQKDVGGPEWYAAEIANALIENFAVLNTMANFGKQARGIQDSVAQIDKLIEHTGGTLPDSVKKEVFLNEWEKELKVMLFDLSNTIVQFAREHLDIDAAQNDIDNVRKTIEHEAVLK